MNCSIYVPIEILDTIFNNIIIEYIIGDLKISLALKQIKNIIGVLKYCQNTDNKLYFVIDKDYKFNPDKLIEQILQNHNNRIQINIKFINLFCKSRYNLSLYYLMNDFYVTHSSLIKMPYCNGMDEQSLCKYTEAYGKVFEINQSIYDNSIGLYYCITDINWELVYLLKEITSKCISKVFDLDIIYNAAYTIQLNYKYARILHKYITDNASVCGELKKLTYLSFTLIYKEIDHLENIINNLTDKKIFYENDILLLSYLKLGDINDIWNILYG